MNTLLTLLFSNIFVACCLAAAAIGLSKLWRSPHLAHSLWCLVLLKLITPPIAQVPIPNLAPTSEYELVAMSTSQVPGRPLRQRSSAGADGTTTDIRAEGGAEHNPAGATRPARVPREVKWTALLLAAWGVGTFLVVYVALRRHRCLLRTIQNSEPADARLVRDAEGIAQQMGLHAQPLLRITSAPICPLAVSGWRKQVILLPRWVVTQLDPVQIKTVLAHELAHIRRGDHWVRFFEAIVLSLHWWNPVAWWAAHRVRQAEEECCDAWVVWALPSERRAYAEALLRTVEYLTGEKLLPTTASAMSLGRSVLHRRLDVILNQMVDRKMSQTACVLTLISGLVVLPVSATQLRTAQASRTKLSSQADSKRQAGRTDAQETDLAAWVRRHGGSFSDLSGSLSLDKSSVTDADLEFLSRIDTSRIKSLFVRGDNFSDAGLKHVTNLTNLHSLNVLSNSVTSEGLRHLTELKQLKSLLIVSKQLDDSGMEHIGAISTLRRLGVPSNKMTNRGLEVLSRGKLHNLQSLNLIRTSIDDSGLQHLQHFPVLEDLHLGATNISDRGLVQIMALPKLEQLNLRKTKITDEGLRHLQKLAGLRSLNLESTAVTDAGIIQLSRSPSLTEVTLSDTAVSRNGFEKLQELNPNVTVLFSPVSIVEARPEESQRVLPDDEAEPSKSLPLSRD